jgi:hypothetical protein
MNPNTNHNTNFELEQLSAYVFEAIIAPLNPVSDKIRVKIDTTNADLFSLAKVTASGASIPDAVSIVYNFDDVTTTNKTLRLRKIRFKNSADGCKWYLMTVLCTTPELDPVQT